MSTPTSTSRPMKRTGQAGFSLVEIIVALVILATGVLGLAATTMYVVRQTTLADVTTERASAVQSVVERIKAVEYTNLSDGDTVIGSFKIAWSVSAARRSSLVNIISVGPGLSSASGVPALSNAVADTFSYRIIMP